MKSRRNAMKVVCFCIMVCLFFATCSYATSKKHKIPKVPQTKHHASINENQHKVKKQTLQEKQEEIQKQKTMTVIVTAYTTRKKECGNNKGITTSGLKAIPWATASAGDDVLHLFNKKKPVKIKVEGFNNVWEITDKKKKGKKGIDLCIGKGTPADVKIAKTIGKSERRITIL